MFELWKPMLEIVINQSMTYRMGNGQLARAYDLREKDSKRVILKILPNSNFKEETERVEKVLTVARDLMNGALGISYDHDAQIWDYSQIGVPSNAGAESGRVETGVVEPKPDQKGIGEKIIDALKRKRGRPRKVAA